MRSEGDTGIIGKWFFGGLLLLLGIYLIPRIILGKDSFVVINDGLDSEILWRYLLAEHRAVFQADAVIEQIMNGLPRAYLISGFNFTVWLFMLFDPFFAYIINQIVVHLVAFSGMFLLLHEHYFKDKKKILPIFICSLCFAFIPFQSIYGLSIAGQPLLLWVFLRIRKNRARFFDYLIVCSFPFFSNFILAGVYIVTALFVFLFIDLFRTKRLNRKMLVWILILAAIYLITEYNLIYNYIANSDFQSHRAERSVYHTEIPNRECYGFDRALFLALRNFFVGGSYPQSLHTPIIVLVFITAVIILIRIYRGGMIPDLIWLFMGLILINFLISLIWSFFYWEGMIPVKLKFPILAAYNLQRFNWLFPFFWYFLLGITLHLIFHNCGRIFRITAILMICIQFLFIWTNAFGMRYMAKFNELRFNSELILNRLLGKDNGIITWNQFISEDLFTQIREHIGKNPGDYRVVSLGIHPSVSQFNGFYTLDSYQNNYPLAYKHQFRKIISKELEKNSYWQRVYDFWGNRCYLFADELKKRESTTSAWKIYFETRKDEENIIRNLEIDATALQGMGGEYIFSAYQIDNARDNRLVLDGVFDTESSPWKIYLYKLMIID